jgi:hypothetical protein
VRVLVAGGRVAGAIERVAAAGEWRTNIALGGLRRPATPTPEACVLATYAAAAVAGDLVGVDLLPLPNGGHVVLEVNGAVEFTTDYSLAGRDVFEEVAKAVGCDAAEIDIAATRVGADEATQPVAEQPSIGALRCAHCGASHVAARPATHCSECRPDGWVRADWGPFTRRQ